MGRRGRRGVAQHLAATISYLFFSLQLSSLSVGGSTTSAWFDMTTSALHWALSAAPWRDVNINREHSAYIYDHLLFLHAVLLRAFVAVCLACVTVLLLGIWRVCAFACLVEPVVMCCWFGEGLFFHILICLLFFTHLPSTSVYMSLFVCLKH